MVELNRQSFSKLLKVAMKNHSIRKVAFELDLNHMIIWRALNNHEVNINAFITIIEYIQRRLLVSYDVIFSQLYQVKEKTENN